MPSVLLTGANRGLALEFTRSFAADGWRVHACCRHPEKAKKLKELSGDIHPHRLDVTDSLQVANLARSLRGETIDLLLNNAGLIGTPAVFGKVDYDDWLEVFKVNTMAPMRLAERFIEHLSGSDRKQIVNVSSRLGSITHNDDGGRYIYRSTKAALNMVVRSMAIDLADKGVTVVAIHPGWVRTDMGGPDGELSPEESVAQMRGLVEKLSFEDSGKFFNHDGSPINW